MSEKVRVGREVRNTEVSGSWLPRSGLLHHLMGSSRNCSANENTAANVSVAQMDLFDFLSCITPLSNWNDLFRYLPPNRRTIKTTDIRKSVLTLTSKKRCHELP